VLGVDYHREQLKEPHCLENYGALDFSDLRVAHDAGNTSAKMPQLRRSGTCSPLF